MLYKSVDKGLNWSVTSYIPHSYYERVIATNDTSIIISADSANLIISFDHGNNWQYINTGIHKTFITSITCNESDLYIGTYNFGVFYSADYGQTWNELNNNLTQWPINTIYLDSNSIYAGMATGVSFLKNDTSEWKTLGNANYGYDYVSPDKIIVKENFIYTFSWYGGMQISFDKGTNWCFINNGFCDVLNNYISDIATIGDTLLSVANNLGIFLSIDFGLHWQNINGNIPLYNLINDQYCQIAVSGSDIFISSFSEGIFKSSDYGLSWVPVNNGIPYDNSLDGYFIVNIQASDSIILAYSEYLNSVYQSKDKGQNWSIVSDSLVVNIMGEIKIDKNRINLVGTHGAKVSTNLGNSWTTISEGLPIDETNIPYFECSSCGIKGNDFLIGTWRHGMYYLYDSTWVPINSGLPMINNCSVSDIAFDDSLIYIGYLGIWRRHISDININKHSGNIFADLNNNNIKDSAEYGMPYVMVEMKRGGSYYTSNAIGNYNAYTEYFQDTIQAINPSPYATVNPLYHIVTLPDSGNNFAVHFIPNVKDLRVTVTNFFNAKPGFNDLIRITYKNVGTDTMNGTVKLVFFDSLVFSGSTPTYTSLNLDTLSWDFNNLMPFESRNINIDFYVPVGFFFNPDSVFLSDSILFSAYIYPVVGDTVPSDNKDSIYQYVTSAYDPNSTEVFPAGCLTPADIAAGEKFVYTIRFQNTGTDTAINVIIIDTLDQNLFVPSFEFLSASHTYTYTIKGNGIVEFDFPNIFLPDSNANQLLSHGFVKFSIKPKGDVQPGTIIQNKADIYFDFNMPIVTNTTLNPVKSVCGTVIIPYYYDGQTILIFPNPSKSFITVIFSNNDKPVIEIYDIEGRRIFRNQSSTEHSLNIDVSKYSKGVYIVKAIFGDSVQSGKFIVQ